ncbi:MAG TPA: hypothetical protein VNH84_08595, partial [Candidatus Saccharimonadales bacterium]|nr:hypothetical protein [Candidatus Saccharimonadales bacterium]
MASHLDATTGIQEMQLPASPAADPIAAFDAWLEKFSNHRDEATTENSLAEGILLARRRRDALFALIEADPQAALAAAVPIPLRARLPAAFDDLLEERVSGRGYFSVQVADNFETGLRQVRREVVVNQQRYEAFVYGT